MSFNSESTRHIAVLVNPSSHASSTSEWGRLRQDLRGGLSAAAMKNGVRCELVDTDAKLADSSAGTLVQVNVFNFKYISEEDRVISGIWGGDAFINVEVEFYQLPGKRLIGKRRYSTSTSALEGALSAATSKQASAIGQEVMAELK